VAPRPCPGRPRSSLTDPRYRDVPRSSSRDECLKDVVVGSRLLQRVIVETCAERPFAGCVLVSPTATRSGLRMILEHITPEEITEIEIRPALPIGTTRRQTQHLEARYLATRRPRRRRRKPSLARPAELEGLGTSLVGAHSHHPLDVEHPHLAVTHHAGSRGRDDRVSTASTARRCRRLRCGSCR